MRRLRLLTWHVHGNYLYNLTQVPHEWFVVTDAARSPHHAGRAGCLPWGANVHEAPLERVRDLAFDAIVFQSRREWDDEQHRILTPAQRALPRLYVEHDPPQAHPTDTRHWVDDSGVLLVHVTPFNALMWDSGRTPVAVIEHGVQPLGDARWHGSEARGLVVVNHLARRGRRLGCDVYLEARERVPLVLAGMGSEALPGGAGEIGQLELPAVLAAHRFFFNPIRWTSLGLAVVEAMTVGMPVVGLATTELAGVIRSGENGIVDTRLGVLIEAMRGLIADRGEAARLGAAARRTAAERFGIARFVADWQAALTRAVR